MGKIPDQRTTLPQEMEELYHLKNQNKRYKGRRIPSQPAGHVFDAAQGKAGSLGCECTETAHVLFFIHQYPKCFSIELLVTLIF